MKVGVLGGGQLGMMMGDAAKDLGITCRFFDPNPDSPAKTSGELIVGNYDDHDVLQGFAHDLDVITYEFENVPVETVRMLQKTITVHPPVLALQTAQDRFLEKTLCTQLGIGVPQFANVESIEELNEALNSIHAPSVLKTRRMGYDGKGQYVLKDEEYASEAWNAVQMQSSILEGFVDFSRELSLIGARNSDGVIVFYPLVENTHRDGILRKTVAPATVDTPLQKSAEQYCTRILEHFNYVGVLAVEFFDINGTLAVNEMAPRVHNSGHWTIEGAATSQFALHLQAVCGLEMGSTEITVPSVMLNVIGEEPDLSAFADDERVHIHLYGKEARAGRKLGHITITDPSEDLVKSIEQLL